MLLKSILRCRFQNNMKRSCSSGALYSGKRVLLGNDDRTVPDVDPGGPSEAEQEIKRIKYGDPVDRFTLKRAGECLKTRKL